MQLTGLRIDSDGRVEQEHACAVVVMVNCIASSHKGTHIDTRLSWDELLTYVGYVPWT